MSYLNAIILAVIEGFSEFLPISSTGHMIIASSLMGIAHLEFTKLFTVCIQLGAVLSVVFLYWQRLVESRALYAKLLVAFLPAAILGKLFEKTIDALLKNVLAVGITLFLGGIVFLFIDRWFERNENLEEKKKLTYRRSFAIGLCQTLALIPGVSRSGATIIGGLTQGLTRASATEFSFLLALPTMLAATSYKLYKFSWGTVENSNHMWVLLILGNAIAFAVAFAVIKFFTSYIAKYGFKAFGYYRIALGLTIIVLYVCGVKLSLV